MDKQKIEEYLELLKKNKELCQALFSWVENECQKLENPKLWDKTNFEIDGKANMKTATKLRLFIFKITNVKPKEERKTSYE